MINGMVILILIVETISDLRTKTISVMRVVFFGIMGIVLQIFMHKQTIESIIGGVLIGGILLLYGKFTGEGIGYGDGLIFACLGCYIGLSENLCLLLFSLILASIVGSIYVIIRRESFQYRIPFVPCILSTFLLMKGIEKFL